MKKLIALLLALILVCSFAACKNDAPVADPAVDAAPEVQGDAEETLDAEESEEERENTDLDLSHDLPMMLEDGTIVDVYEFYGEEPPVVEENVANNAALAVLKSIWSIYGDDEKFAIIGGNMEAGIMDVPGVWDMEYKDGLTTTLLIPAEQLDNVTEAATMVHMMNTNTFSGGIVKLAEGADVAAFAQAVRDAIQNNQWLCGMPEKLMISNLDNGFVLIAYGLNDAMSVFEGKVATMYADAESLFNEAIGG